MILALSQVSARREASKKEPSLSQRVVLSAVVDGAADDVSRDRIRRLFYSPIGVYVSHALRERECLRLEFDIASVDLDFMIRTLQSVLPEAVIDGIRPRVFNHQKH